MIKSVLFTTLGFIAVILLLIVDANQAQALDENNCLECHRNPKLFTTNGEGRQISLYIDEAEVNTAAVININTKCTLRVCTGNNWHRVTRTSPPVSTAIARSAIPIA